MNIVYSRYVVYGFVESIVALCPLCVACLNVITHKQGLMKLSSVPDDWEVRRACDHLQPLENLAQLESS